MNMRTMPFFLLFLIATCFPACNALADDDGADDAQSTSSLVASPAAVSLKVGESATIALTGAVGKVSVNSDKKSVASASYSSGTVTIKGQKSGTTKIKIKDQQAETYVSVTVARMSVSPTALSLGVGSSGTITVGNATGPVKVSSSNTKVASVSYAGTTATVQGLAAGSARIKFTDKKTTLYVTVTVSSIAVSTTDFTLLAWNDLGMHCMDGIDFSVFTILPPYNTLHAQIKDKSGKLITDNVLLSYEAVADSTGSINTYSAGKTNFWDWVQDLFGLAPEPDVGLNLDGLASGAPAPGNRTPSLTPQPMSFNSEFAWFEAEGIPVTPIDDAGKKNFYPTVKVTAKDPSGTVLATTTTVLPVSDEMTCKACHTSTDTGNAAAMAAKPADGWVYDTVADKDWKRNILKLHDEKQKDLPLYATALAATGYSPNGLLATADAGKPVLCVACHGSNAYFDKKNKLSVASGVAGIAPFTQSIHSKHAQVHDPLIASMPTLDSLGNTTACYLCHPGSATRCLRGAMGKAVDANGNALMNCQSCHGSMAQVGSSTRQGWFQEPTCESCHNQAAPNRRAINGVTSSGLPIVPADRTFKTNDNTPVPGLNLYRFSKGHGGLQCEACHGSTHAEYPSLHADDNTQSIAVQGHAGTVAECLACHKAMPSTVNGGPHGMHSTGNAWVGAHEDADKSGCAYCHGTTSAGTPLSAVKVARTFSFEGRTKTYAAGSQVSCYDCHNGPNP